MPKALDLTGQTFGRLSAVAPHGRLNGGIAWQCRCECGAATVVRSNSLRRGLTKSCGCLHSETAAATALKYRVSHGACGTPEHNAWREMKARCNNPNRVGYRYWGGCGVTVCQEWLDSFEAFLAHIGPRPSPKHSVDRFPDNNGNYEPGNVRWATSKEQRANRREASHV
jgi:hypothetical protein